MHPESIRIDADFASSVNALRQQVDSSIDAFVEATALLTRCPSQDTAEDACLACREAVQTYFLARGDFGQKASSKTDALVAALDHVENELKQLADELGADSIVSCYLDNVQRRKDLIHALLDDNIALVKTILKRDRATVSAEGASSTPPR